MGCGARFAVTVGYVRDVCFRTTNGRPYHGNIISVITVGDGGWCTFAGAQSDAPTTVGDKRNGYRINEGLHPRCPIAHVREVCERISPDRISSHIRSGKCVADRRADDGDIGSRAAPGAATEPRECVSTRLFPRSGIQWRHFWFRLFRKKAE